MYFVSRQHYYYQDEYFVEIAYPSIDYSSPDMLICKYSGEGESYTDPREAVQVAIKIRDQWKEDLKGEDKDREISISYGSFKGIEGFFTASPALQVAVTRAAGASRPHSKEDKRA